MSLNTKTLKPFTYSLSIDQLLMHKFFV